MFHRRAATATTIREFRDSSSCPQDGCDFVHIQWPSPSTNRSPMAKRRPKRAPATPPGIALFQMITGKCISKAIATVVELGIPDHLGKGARTAAEIARQSGASEDGVYRLLRALASVGVFVE